MNSIATNVAGFGQRKKSLSTDDVFFGHKRKKWL